MLKKSELEILNAVVESDKAYSVYSLAKELDKPQSTVFNLCRIMTERDLLRTDIELSSKNVPKKILILTELGFCEYVLNSEKYDEALCSLTKKVQLIRRLKNLNICTKCMYLCLRAILSEQAAENEIHQKSELINTLIYVQNKTCGEVLYLHMANLRSDKYSCFALGSESNLGAAHLLIHEQFVSKLFENIMKEFPINSDVTFISSVSSAILNWFIESEELPIIKKYFSVCDADHKRITFLQQYLSEKLG